MGGKKEAKYTEYYDLVGCKADATPEEIKKAYRRTALRLHPDRGGDEEEFKKMKAAYDVISDPSKRKVYDKFGPQVVRAMDGEIPTSMDFISNLRKRDRFMMVAIISIVSAIILLFPILLSVRWNADESDSSNSNPYSWAIPFIPVWVLQGLFLIVFMMETELKRLDETNPDVDAEAKAMWKEQKNALNTIRAVVLVPWCLLVLFEVFVVLRLDNAVSWSWIVVMIPWIVLQVFTVAARLQTAPSIFVRLDPRFNKPETEEEAAAMQSGCTKEVFSDPAFWLFALVHVKWSLALLITAILVGVIADMNESGNETSFFYAAIPLLVVIGLALIIKSVLALITPANPQPEASAEGTEEAGKPSEEPPQGLVAVFIGWACTYGMILIMVTTAAAKLTDVDSLSAFAIFSPIFFVVGCLCCVFSCFALTVSAEDLQQGMQAEYHQQQQQHQNEQEEGVNVDIPPPNYGTNGETVTEEVKLTIS